MPEEKLTEPDKELTLKESESKYRELFDNAHDSMYTLDTAGCFQTINRAGLKILGAEKEEIIGSHISKWLTPESLKAALEVLKKQIAGEDVEHPVLLEVICKNGEHKWGEIRTRCMRDGDRITGIHGIARDITEKKKLEQELLASEAKYRDLFENADDPMFTLNEDGHFVALNTAGLKILGCATEEIIGTHISEWMTKESYGITREVMKKRMLGEAVEPPSIIEMICKNGEHRWVEGRSRLIKDGDRITGFHGIARNITEKRRLEQQLEEYHNKLLKSYEELIEADRMKTEFVSNITHELLTPMTSIRGFTELLMDGTAGKINDKQKKSLEIILRNSDRLIRLIKDLLDAANLEKKSFGMQFELVSVNDIISKCVQDITPEANKRKITIVRGTSQISSIWGDEERLTQVIMNLIVNAIKFTPEEGTITIASCEDKDCVRISMADTGIGIPADQLCRIFDRFYQIDGSNSRKYGGTGLGLSICKSIIEKHYGSIWAESSGNGSIFHITLPMLGYEKKKEG